MSALKINKKIANQTVLLLVDFASPFAVILPTIKLLSDNRNKTIVLSHYGQDSLAEKAALLAERMNRKFIDLPREATRLPEYDIPHLFFARRPGILSGMRPGDIGILENLYLLSAEETDRLTLLGEIFVNDYFMASEQDIRSLKKSLASGVGLAFARQEMNLRKFFSRIKDPLVIVLGEVWLSGQELILEKLFARADTILLGGGAANLFLELSGFEIGESIVDRRADKTLLRNILRDHRNKIKLPRDVITTRSGSITHKPANRVTPGDQIVDIGPETTLEFSQYLKSAQTIIWSGALGRVEDKVSRHGTAALLRLAASRPDAGGIAMAASGQDVLDLLASGDFLLAIDFSLPQSRDLLQVLSSHDI